MGCTSSNLLNHAIEYRADNTQQKSGIGQPFVGPTELNATTSPQVCSESTRCNESSTDTTMDQQDHSLELGSVDYIQGTLNELQEERDQVLLVQEIVEHSDMPLALDPSEMPIKPCCGRSCQLQGSLCCEHESFTYTSPSEYCSICRARYIERQEIHPSSDEDTPKRDATISVGHICDPGILGQPQHPVKKEDTPPIEKLGRICQDGCPVCLAAFSISSGPLCVLCCGHAICHSHLHKLHNCPLCRHPIDDAETKGDLEEAMTQAERYDIMNRSE